MFEKELFICIKIDLVINNLQRLICDKTNKQINKQTLNLKNKGYDFLVSRLELLYKEIHIIKQKDRFISANMTDTKWGSSLTLC